jgi:hypothetical protein
LALLAFVVPSAGRDARELHGVVKQAVRQQLPGFMRPSRIVMLAHMPRLPSGKVDRPMLLAMTASRVRMPWLRVVARYGVLAVDFVATRAMRLARWLALRPGVVTKPARRAPDRPIT